MFKDSFRSNVPNPVALFGGFGGGYGSKTF
jgi:hypothetical protein